MQVQRPGKLGVVRCKLGHGNIRATATALPPSATAIKPVLQEQPWGYMTVYGKSELFECNLREGKYAVLYPSRIASSCAIAIAESDTLISGPDQGRRAGTGSVGCGSGISGEMGACRRGASFRGLCPLLNYSYLHLIDTR